MSDYHNIAEFGAGAILSKISRSRGQNFKLLPEILFTQKSDRVRRKQSHSPGTASDSGVKRYRDAILRPG